MVGNGRLLLAPNLIYLITVERVDGGRDECKASPPAIPPCHSESSRSVLSSSDQRDKTQRTVRH